MEDRILLVDDEPEILHSLKMFLEFSGYVVDTAENAKEALSLVEEKKFNVAVLDIMMPEMDGIELLQEIKARDFSIQVIMMTAYTSFDKTLKSLQHGAIDYVLKPLSDMDEFLDLIKESCRRVKRWRKALTDTVKITAKR